MRHLYLSTHQGISLGQKIVGVHVHRSEKRLVEQVVYIFGANKNTNYFVKRFRVQQHSQYKYSEDIAAH